MTDCLSMSLVVYHSDNRLLQQTLQTLYLAAEKAEATGLVDSFFLTVVDNAGHSDIASSDVLGLLHKVWPTAALAVYARGNVGYGAAHNLAIQSKCGSFHLVINPDVVVHEDALIESIKFFLRHSQVGMITPQCHRPNGQREYLCKTYPSLAILLLRGFAPAFLKRFFKTSLDVYEAKNQGDEDNSDILIASGCFMLFRQQALLDVQGFCEQFFLYFEDFDLSLRLITQWKIAYVPAVKIIHFGGHSAKKGWRHIGMFAKSAQLFFRLHGWRFF